MGKHIFSRGGEDVKRRKMAGWAVGLLVVAGSGGRLFHDTAKAREICDTSGENLGFFEQLMVKQSPFLSSGLLLFEGVSAENSPLDSPESASFTPDVDLITAEEGVVSSPSAPSATILAQTIRPSNYRELLSADGVYLQNRTNQTVDMEALAATPIELNGSKSGPSILIVHTHSTESYSRTAEDRYDESDAYRTTDTAHNVIRVGDEMAAAYARAGLNVLHDRNLYDYPNYNGAYSRSKAAIEQYLKLYPSISVVLDVHRDALEGEDGSIYKVVTAEEDAEECAQIMLVVGTEEGGGSSHPNWRENLSFAIGLQRTLNDSIPSLARPITLRKSHYNQQLCNGSVLVEVGTHGNSLAEAIHAAKAFAESTAPYIAELLPE